MYQALIEAGDSMRAAERQSLAGSTTAVEAARSRRDQAVTTARESIEAIFAQHDAALGEPIRRRIGSSLEALASYGSRCPEPPPGRLVEDIAPPGFAALAALAAEPVQIAPAPPEASRPQPPKQSVEKPPAPDPRKERAERRLTQAESDLTRAQRAFEQRTSQLEAAEKALAIAREVVTDAQRRVDELRQARADTEQILKQAVDERRDALAETQELES